MDQWEIILEVSIFATQLMVKVYQAQLLWNDWHPDFEQLVSKITEKKNRVLSPFFFRTQS